MDQQAPLHYSTVNHQAMCDRSNVDVYLFGIMEVSVKLKAAMYSFFKDFINVCKIKHVA